MKLRFYKIFCFVFLFGFYSKTSFAQCINTFPHTENFETSATWSIGGVNSDWAWGTPTKPVINSAAGGLKCWITGGLNNSNYNGSQQSYIESPCYDFSSLSFPVVRFKVFWEMEFHYDGANLQYSINNGAWQILGASGQTPNCGNQNWFNYGGVNFLSWTGNKSGWSGNSQPSNSGCQGGSGSMGWVEAKHCLAGLAGKSNVKFRFTFGSGQTCNGFDGFAIDDFTVENALPNSITFTNSCNSFTSIGSACSGSLNYMWNFGDVASGASNTSTVSNPTHFYSHSGVYTVSLTTTGGLCGANTVFSKTVAVMGSSIIGESDVTCKGGSNGSATVVAINGSNVSYTWSPKGGNDATTNILSAGMYTVYLSDANGCLSSNTVNINEPNSSTGADSYTIVSCLGNNTVLSPTITGISDPITYSWMPGGFTSPSITVSPSATSEYTLILSISGGCPKTEQKVFTNVVVPKPSLMFSNSITNGCAPLCINLTDNSTTTSGSITSWVWQFSDGTYNNEANPVICFNKPGVYMAGHGVVNSYGCSNYNAEAFSFTVYPTPVADFIIDNNNFTDLEPVLVKFKDASTANPISWEWNFAGLKRDTLQNADFIFFENGSYPVILNVTNKFGCSGSVTHYVNVLPEFTFYAPNSFSPNNDNVNDVFLPMGKGWDETGYRLAIYDRWGEELFMTKTVGHGWDGKAKNAANYVPEGDYIYKVEVSDSSKKLHSYVGHISVIK